MAMNKGNNVSTVTASTTQTQAGGALALVQGDVTVVTVDNSSDSVGIPANLPAGTVMFIVNASSNAGKIWPPAGGTINAASTDAEVALAASTMSICVVKASGAASTYSLFKLSTL